MKSSVATNLYDQLPQGYRLDQQFGPVYDQAPSRADDLTQIRGIDTREVVILNRLGVYYFSQIALWSQRQTGRFASELGMSRSTLVDEQWTQQAQTLCIPRPNKAPTAPLPASAVRTISLLTCALLVGCIFVYWLSQKTNRPLTGVLSADITSLRVPTEARLTDCHIEPGDEVFSGDPMLTLEKTEQLATIEMQERRVQELARQLEQATAQAALDLESKNRELEREISDVRTQAQLIRRLQQPKPRPTRTAQIVKPDSVKSPYSTVSQTRTRTRASAPPRRLSGRTNGMIFVAGQTGESSANQPRASYRPRPLTVPHPQPIAATHLPNPDLLVGESVDMESRLKRLEDFRTVLPEQVRRAAGVESVRVQFEEAAQRLEEMKALSREVSVLCPAYGKVGQVRYKVGDTMSPGEVMLKILHTDRRYILALVPTRRVNEIQPGVTVDLTFPGSEKFRGKVSNMPMLAESTMPGGQSLATVRIEPVGRLWPEIPIGSQVDVFVNTDGVF